MWNLISFVLAAISLLVSLLTFLDTRPAAQLKREQTAKLRAVVENALVLWEQIRVVITAHTKQQDIDPYIYAGMRTTALRLEDALHGALGLGLRRTLADDKRDGDTLFAAFLQSLISAAGSDEDSPEPWLKQHLVMGMIRLQDVLRRDARTRAVGGDRFEATDPEMLEQAWTYLRRPAAAT